MSNEKTPQDPSMEDILASIRRIISEDEEAVAGAESESDAVAEPDGEADAASDDGAGDDDVLELTQMVRADGSTVDLTQDALETEPEPEPEPEPQIQPEPEPEIEVEPELADPKDVEALISEAAASASIGALSKLARASDPSPVEDLGLRFSDSGRTIEDLVVEMIRPMLRDWLDRNLPMMVERIVQKEIRKLVRQSDPD